MGRTRRGGLGLVSAAAMTLAACMGPQAPNPLDGQTRFTCCNIHYEKPEITDVNFQQGTLIPLGTRVQILEVGRNRIRFQPEGHPPITLARKYGRRQLTLDQFVEQVLVADNPRARLRKLTPKIQKLIEQGTVEPGMRRDDVLMALGYPPAHRTPSLQQLDWHYWENRWHQFIVFFDGEKVDRVQQ